MIKSSDVSNVILSATIKSVNCSVSFMQVHKKRKKKNYAGSETTPCIPTQEGVFFVLDIKPYMSHCLLWIYCRYNIFY